ncbi:MAG: hypothetical protein ACOH1E_05420 [Brevundimonas sp.]
MKTATIRKALLPVLAASAVMVSTPALAQSFGVTLSFGSPGYSQGYGPTRGYSARDLQYRARTLARYIDRLAWSSGANRNQARYLAAEMNQYQRVEHLYARNGLTAREYADLDQRLDRIQYRVQRVQRVRW